MKVTFLSENNTLIDQYYMGEPGLSLLIEESGQKVLFDTGCGIVFLENAEKMGIHLWDIDAVVLSHGHHDHTGGLEFLIKYMNTDEYIKKRGEKDKIKLFFHPEALKKKFDHGESIGIRVEIDSIDSNFDRRISSGPKEVAYNLFFLGEIPRENDFETAPIGFTINEKGNLVDDFVLDDTALVYKSKDGLVIITGCSHSGICNIMEYAKKVCSDNRIYDVIGGLHLQKAPMKLLEKTTKYFSATYIDKLHACHCTDFAAKLELSKVCEIEEVGVGTILEYE